MQSADHCKRRAAECVRMAEQSRHPSDRAMLLQMAQIWLRLADKADDRRGDQTTAPPGSAADTRDDRQRGRRDDP